MNVRRHLLPIAALLLLPLLWLWPHAIGQRLFVPFDAAEFPPASLLLSPQQYQDVREGANYDVTELPAWFLPELTFAKEELAADRWPVWNPHARSGAPLHAHGLLGLLYPPNWLALAHGEPARALWLLAWISLCIAGLGAYGLFRELGMAALPAWFGAAVWQLSAPMAANAFFWMRLSSLAWLPMLLWALLRLARHDTLRALPTTAVAVTFAMPWLAGFPPYAAAGTVIAGLFVLVLAAQRARQGDGAWHWRDGGRLLARLAFAVGLGALLTLPQVLPSLLFFPESARTTAASLERHLLARFDAYGLLGYLLPDLVSHPTAQATLPYGQSPLALWLCDRHYANGRGALPNYNYTEYSVFAGTLTLALAVVGAVLGRGRLRLFAVATFVLLLCLALFVPGFDQLFLLPLIANVWPMRWLAPGSLLLAWLAALGLQRLLQAPRPFALWLGGALLATGVAAWWLAGRPAAWYSADPNGWPQAIAERVAHDVDTVHNFVRENNPLGIDRFAAAGERAAAAGRRSLLWCGMLGSALLAFGLLPGRRARHGALAVVLTLALLEPLLHGAPLLRGITGEHPVQTQVHEFLRERAQERAGEGGFTIARASRHPILPIQLPPGQLLEPGLRDLQFYTHFDARSLQPMAHLLPGELGAQHTSKGYLTTSLPQSVPGLFAHPYLDLCGVRFLLATEALEHAGTRVGPELRGPRGEFFVYERTSALPRAFAVPGLEVLPADDAVLHALTDVALDPRRQVFVCATDPGIPAARRVSPPQQPRRVQFTMNHATCIELQLEAGDEPWLVLTDTFLPGWTATVDGKAVPLHRGNHWMRLVEVPPQACRVVFSYSAPGLGTGVALALLAIVSLLGLGAWHGWRAVRRPAQAAG